MLTFQTLGIRKEERLHFTCITLEQYVPRLATTFSSRFICSQLVPIFRNCIISYLRLCFMMLP